MPAELAEEQVVTDWSTRFPERGVTMIEHALSKGDLRRMRAMFAHGAGRRHSPISPGHLHWLAAHERLDALVNRLAGRAARLVRVIAFDKRSRTEP